MNKEDRRAIEFFARLLSVQDFSQLATREQEPLRETAEVLSPLTDLPSVYAEGRKLLSSFARGGKAIVPFRLVLEKTDGKIAIGWAESGPGLSLLSRLISILIRERKFPFRTCSVCGVLFAPRGRQLTCSLRCTRKKMEVKRKARKRAYMRLYMVRRRAEEKAMAQATKKALAKDRAGKPPAGEKEFADSLKSLRVLPVETDEERSSRQQAEQKRLNAKVKKQRQFLERMKKWKKP